jgi:ribosomal protein S18 acetylase RimI-like enzyme
VVSAGARPVFRPMRGEADYPGMLEVIHGSEVADGQERTDTLEEITRNYQHLVNCDPSRDVIIVEAGGRVIGYSRVWWVDDDGHLRRYLHLNYLLPEWRGQGIRRALMRQAERRLIEIAAEHSIDLPRYFEAFAADTESHWESLLVEDGYTAAGGGLQMVRPTLDDIPDLPLPDGLEVRPVQPEHVPAILAASKEAFRDHWGFSEEAWDKETEGFLQHPLFQPHLWQVAWDGDEVAGQVQNFIDTKENEAYGRKRGYTEGISVRRPWRRRGLAHALIARSFHVLKEQGMTEAALGCDAENLSGAVRVYTAMGFRTVKRFTAYRKRMERNA